MQLLSADCYFLNHLPQRSPYRPESRCTPTQSLCVFGCAIFMWERPFPKRVRTVQVIHNFHLTTTLWLRSNGRNRCGMSDWMTKIKSTYFVHGKLFAGGDFFLWTSIITGPHSEFIMLLWMINQSNIADLLASLIPTTYVDRRRPTSLKLCSNRDSPHERLLIFCIWLHFICITCISDSASSFTVSLHLPCGFLVMSTVGYN